MKLVCSKEFLIVLFLCFTGYKDEDIPSEEEEDIEIGYFMSAENSARATTPTGGAVYVATTFCILCLTTTFTSRILSHLSNVLS